jgi:hypothetical protein
MLLLGKYRKEQRTNKNNEVANRFCAIDIACRNRFRRQSV